MNGADFIVNGVLVLVVFVTVVVSWPGRCWSWLVTAVTAAVVVLMPASGVQA